MANKDKDTLQGDLPGGLVFGVEGKSAYQVAVARGYVGTEEDWLKSLIGPAGTSITRLYNGLVTASGKKHELVVALSNGDEFRFPYSDGEDGKDGEAGRAIYPWDIASAEANADDEGTVWYRGGVAAPEGAVVNAGDLLLTEAGDLYQVTLCSHILGFTAALQFNISCSPDAILCIEQALDDTQKAQARTNIGAADAEIAEQAQMLAALAMPGSLKWDGVIGDREHVTIEEDGLLMAFVKLTDEVPDFEMLGETAGFNGTVLASGNTLGLNTANSITLVDDGSGVYGMDGAYIITTRNITENGITITKGIWTIAYNLLPMGYDISLMYGSGLLIPGWSFGETSGSGGEYFEKQAKITEKSVGETLTWDGDATGRVSIAIEATDTSSETGMYVKISNDILTDADFVGGATVGYIADGVAGEQEQDYDTYYKNQFIDGGYAGVFAIAPYDGYVKGGITFPEAGVYFGDILDQGSSIVVTSLTIPGYNFTKQINEEATVIKTEHLPERLQFGYKSDIGSFTVEGSTVICEGCTGQYVTEDLLLVTRDTDWFTKAIAEATSITAIISDSETPIEASFVQVGTDLGIAAHDEAGKELLDCEVFVSLGGNSPGFSAVNGVYLFGNKVKSLTFNGYDLERAVNPRMEEECLPESVESVVIRSSTEGSEKKFRITVDDTGTPSVSDDETTEKLATETKVQEMIDNSIPEGGAADADAVNTLIDSRLKSVKSYGAVGDGVTDDAEAFQAALAAETVVFVPGGTYKLSGELAVRDGCELRLSIDTVLDFTQTSGNCITLNMSSTLRGNHGTVRVPYTFDGNVVYVSTTTIVETEDLYSPYPFNHWDPMWKHARYLTDLNIVKPDPRGSHTSYTGDCYGIAVYISADNSTAATYIWGLNFSGLRICGGFRYGIRAQNFNTKNATYYAWNHEMRIEAFIQNCEIGVSLEHCNNAYVSAIIEPRYGEDLSVSPATITKYAKHGIELISSTHADLSGSRVWDWDTNGTLWEAGGQWQHIGMYGDCHGAIINAFQYYDVSIDIRDLIYTDTASNLEKLVIVQEPITRWFKPVNNEPYFSNGDSTKRLAYKQELDEYFQTDRIAGYTDVLATAIDSDGTIYNEIGYSRSGGTINGAGAVNTAQAGYYGHTGFIACVNGSVLHIQGITLDEDSDTRLCAYDAEFNLLFAQNCHNIIPGTSYFYPYAETEDGFTITITNLPECAYVRFGLLTRNIGSNPIIAVDEEIKYLLDGFLADGVKVKGDNLMLYSAGGKAYKLTVSDTGELTATEVTV